MVNAESVLDAYRKDAEKETAIECVKLLHGIMHKDAPENDFSFGNDLGIEMCIREICEHFGLDLREALDD